MSSSRDVSSSIIDRIIAPFCRSLAENSLCFNEHLLTCSPHILHYLFPINYVIGRAMVASCTSEEEPEEEEGLCEEAVDYYLRADDSCYAQLTQTMTSELIKVQPDFDVLCT